MEMIRSRQNDKIRLARSLKQRKKREEEKRFLIEGLFHLGEALEAKATFDYVLVAPNLIRNEFGKKLLADFEESDIALFDTDEKILDELSLRETSSGFLGIGHSQYLMMENVPIRNSQRLLALVRPQDPGNVGSILRSIDAFGADGLLLLDGGVDAYHPAAIRAGMGAHFWKQIIRASFADFTDWAKKHGVQILGSSAKGGIELGRVKSKSPYVLLMGSEREGLSEDHLAHCQRVIALPMQGRSTSLNLSVAAGIMLFGLENQDS